MANQSKQLQDIGPAKVAESITNNDSTNKPSKAIYVGVAGNYDFYVGGAWILFNGCLAGTVLPISATGARHAADTAPDAGDIVFLR